MSTVQPPTTKVDILRLLLKREQATAQELAEHLGISRQAMRRHLKDLEGEELIQHEAVTLGLGRPQHVYRLSRKGRTHFPAGYDQFAVSLLHTLAETLPAEDMQEVLQRQWQRKAEEYRQEMGQGPLVNRLNQLVQLRRAEGYMAEWHPAEGGQGNQFVVTEYNCAIASIAESFPRVCNHELELFASALPDCEVERTHWLIGGEHRCGYLICRKG
jgi:DeoR family transcriptional regulator, suf operon transcriptional repressor